MHDTEIVGRDEELRTISSFLEQSTSTGALLIEGEAGIGKTTLWRYGVEHAVEHGWQVLTAGPAASEARLAFAAIGDLLRGVVHAVAPRLAPPQQHALEVALLLKDARGRPPERRTVAVAVLEALRALAEERPLLVAVDDIQWLDRPSADVLSFVARRLGDEPVALLLARRTDKSRGMPLELDRAFGERLARVRPGQLSLGATHRLLRSHLGLTLPRPAARRVHTACGGNPLFAVEIGRILTEKPEVLLTDEPLPVPNDVRQLAERRIKRLSRPARKAVLAAALLREPTAELVEQAADSPGLEEALGGGILVANGDRLRFAHPLFAEAATSLTSASRRREMHLRLAELLADREVHGQHLAPEERARHLALAAAGPDPQVASTLDEAAQLAQARGAPEAAAELSELARRLTPVRETEALRLRMVQAAQHHFEAGDAVRSTKLFEEAIDSAPPGPDRARILLLCGEHAWMNLDRVGAMCERTLAEAEGEDDVIVGAHENLAWVAIYRGDLRSASCHAAAAMQHAEAISSSQQRAEAEATFGMVEFLIGRPAEAIMSGADRLQEIGTAAGAGSEGAVYTSARTNHGLQLLWAGELDASRQLLGEELRAQDQRGLYLVREEVLSYLAEVECRAGNWEDAARHADEAYEINVESGHLLGSGHSLFYKALVEAHRGDVEAAKSDAEEGLRVSIANGDPFYASCNRSVLGFVELSRSRPSVALEQLLPVVEYLHVMGAAEPGVIPCVPDAIECLVSIGELEDAERLLDEHEQKGRRLDRPWAIATAGRCRGLILAARGDMPAALEALNRTLREHERVRQPFELARTLLVNGEVARRGKRRRVARETLLEALTIFESLGAPLWAERTREEIARISGRRAHAADELTPSERRIAELVADGKTNKEVAAILVVADRTVEGALTQIYRKLEVRSRTELARKLGGSG